MEILERFQGPIRRDVWRADAIGTNTLTGTIALFQFYKRSDRKAHDHIVKELPEIADWYSCGGQFAHGIMDPPTKKRPSWEISIRWL